MSKDVSINLLRTQSILTSQETTLLSRLRLVSIGLLVMVVTSGLFVALAYAAGVMRVNNLENEKLTVTRRIAIQARKEIMLNSLKQRLPSIDRILQNQFNWQDIMAYVTDIAAPPLLTGATIDEKSVVTLTIVTTSLEDLQTMTNKLSQLNLQRKIKNPGIKSLVVTRENAYQVDLYFTPQL